MPEQSRSAASQSGLSDNGAGGLAYILLVPAMIFLATEPYNRNSYIRFHAWQSIFLALAFIAIEVVVRVFAMMFSFMGLFWIFGLAPLITLAMLILWIMVLIKAFNGERFKLPIIGDLAEKQANG